jgi:hypothetical protein
MALQRILAAAEFFGHRFCKTNDAGFTGSITALSRIPISPMIELMLMIDRILLSSSVDDLFGHIEYTVQVYLITSFHCSGVMRSNKLSFEMPALFTQISTVQILSIHHL